MRCAKCGTVNRSSAKFCEECGTHLVLPCPGCGALVSVSKKFCGDCGAPLASQLLVATSHISARHRQPFTPVPRPPVAYTPSHLASRILSEKTRLEGERKIVTCLFADIKGSMDIMAELDPEEAKRLFDPCLQCMMDAVHRCEGTVNRVLGDGIMALFGAPLALEDHPQRALYAAVSMQTAVSRYATELRRNHGITLQIRVGINTGEVVVRAIGNDLHMDYSAVGHAVGLAARMEALAKPGSTLVTAHTYRLTKESFHFAPQGPIQIKGVREPTEVYELVGPDTVRSRLAVRAARGLSPLVGRGRELEYLQELATLVSNGTGQAVSLVGEAGVGKSRVLEELKPVLRERGYLMIEGGGFPYGKTRAYQPLIDMLKRYCGIGEHDDPTVYQEKLQSSLAQVSASLVEFVPVFLELFGVESRNPRTAGLSSEARLQKILAGTQQLIARQSLDRPVAMLIEDLHWLDARSLAFLQALITNSAARRVFFLFSYRPGNAYSWEDQSFCHRLRITPLQRDASESLFATLVGTDSAVAALAPQVCEQSEGNPFFLEEIIQSLRETGVLTGQAGTYTLARPLSGWTLPATVQGLLASRIDHLSPMLKTLLQTAAAIGREFSRPLLARVSNLPEAKLQQALTALETREFLYQTTEYPDTGYRFKHALTQEVAYQSLLHEHRAALHAAVGAVVEVLYTDRLTEYVPVLAYHYARSNDTAKAMHYLHLAAQRAFDLHADTDALQFWEEHLRLLMTLPAGAARYQLEVRTRLHLITVLTRQSTDDGPMQTQFAAAEEACRQLEDGRLLAKLHGIMAQAYMLWGRPRLGLKHARAATALARSLDDARLLVLSLGSLSSLLWMSGRLLDSLQAADEGIRLVKQQNLFNESRDFVTSAAVECMAIAGVCRAFLGDFAQGTHTLSDAVMNAQQHETHVPLGLSHASLALLFMVRGDTNAALREAEIAVAVMQNVGASSGTLLVGCVRDYLAALQSQNMAPVPFLTQTWHEKRAFSELAGAWLAEAAVRRGQHKEALRLAQEAVHTATASESAWFLCVAHAALGHVCAQLSPANLTAATTHLSAALAYAEMMPSPPFYARIAHQLGEVLWRKRSEVQSPECQLQEQESTTAATQEKESAETYLRRAVDLYEQLGMNADLGRARALLAGLNVSFGAVET